MSKMSLKHTLTRQNSRSRCRDITHKNINHQIRKMACLIETSSESCTDPTTEQLMTTLGYSVFRPSEPPHSKNNKKELILQTTKDSINKFLNIKSEISYLQIIDKSPNILYLNDHAVTSSEDKPLLLQAIEAAECSHALHTFIVGFADSVDCKILDRISRGSKNNHTTYLIFENSFDKANKYSFQQNILHKSFIYSHTESASQISTRSIYRYIAEHLEPGISRPAFYTNAPEVKKYPYQLNLI